MWLSLGPKNSTPQGSTSGSEEHGISRPGNEAEIYSDIGGTDTAREVTVLRSWGEVCSPSEINVQRLRSGAHHIRIRNYFINIISYDSCRKEESAHQHPHFFGPHADHFKFRNYSRQSIQQRNCKL